MHPDDSPSCRWCEHYVAAAGICVHPDSGTRRFIQTMPLRREPDDVCSHWGKFKEVAAFAGWDRVDRELS